jgi:hypothetical protein
MIKAATCARLDNKGGNRQINALTKGIGKKVLAWKK